jgi:cytochrome c biogenesis protein CcdA
MKFQLTENQSKLALEWMEEKRTEKQGAIGGQFTYQFTPCSIGVFVSIVDCVTKEELDLSEYDNF